MCSSIWNCFTRSNMFLAPLCKCRTVHHMFLMTTRRQSKLSFTKRSPPPHLVNSHKNPPRTLFSTADAYCPSPCSTHQAAAIPSRQSFPISLVICPEFASQQLHSLPSFMGSKCRTLRFQNRGSTSACIHCGLHGFHRCT